MSEVTKLPTAHSDIDRRDAIDAAITDLMTLSDLLQMASDELTESDGGTIRHVGVMMYDRADKLKRLTQALDS